MNADPDPQPWELNYNKVLRYYLNISECDERQMEEHGGTAHKCNIDLNSSMVYHEKEKQSDIS